MTESKEKKKRKRKKRPKTGFTVRYANFGQTSGGKNKKKMKQDFTKRKGKIHRGDIKQIQRGTKNTVVSKQGKRILHEC